MFIQKHAPTGDVFNTSGELVNLARRRFRDCWITVTLAAVMWVAPAAVLSHELSWHEYSHSYEIHLGVVPASVADRDSALIEMHKIAPHGAVKRSEALRHILVAVFRRSGHERVVDAQVNAEVIENDLIHTKREKKSLDRMMLPNGESYCNFFTLHWNGRYRIRVSVAEPGREPEWVVFEQDEENLSF